MTTSAFSKFLNQISPEPLYVLDPNIPPQAFTPLDLSVTNQELQKINTASSKDLEAYVFGVIQSKNAKVGYGGYNETRNLYQRSLHFNQNDVTTERNIHLGMDLWIEAGTPIFATLEGKIHSFKNNANYGDYGPTIVLRHEIEGVEFYTLYGHLSLESLSALEVGQTIQKGECLATLGDASVNGDYPPHLHFQIIKDMQGLHGDYPGVCAKQDVDFYLGNCPDPNLLLKIG